MTDGELLTTAQVCELIGVTRATVSRWVAIGFITPAKKLPGERGAFLFHPDEVERHRLRDNGYTPHFRGSSTCSCAMCNYHRIREG